MGCVGIGGLLGKVMFLNGEEDEEGLSVMLGGIWKKMLWLWKVGDEAIVMKSWRFNWMSERGISSNTL